MIEKSSKTRPGKMQRKLDRVWPIVLLGLLLPVTSVWASFMVTDMTVSDAVQDELSSDAAVPAELIDVDANEGVVTLSGMVNNLLAKERAANIAETVKGVRSVVNNITVFSPIARSDKEIGKDIETSLLFDSATESYEIDVSVDNGVVSLKGVVDSWQERRLCEQVAKGVRGVTAVHNRIDVNYKHLRADSEIKPEIEKVLKWNTLVDDALIRVKVDDGHVDLSGTVGSAAEKSRAQALAYVAGVKSVSAEDLKVERWMRDKDLRKNKYVAKTDQEIRDAVKDAFIYDPRVKSFNVDVSVENGTVTLRGEVDNLKARQAAMRDARNTVGVSSVVNRLKVRPARQIDDKTIEKRIREALRLNPYVDNFELTVVVVNGLVDLYGTVDNYFEKAKAEDVASRVNGVVGVDNNIDVSWSYSAFPYDPYTDTWRSYDYPWYRAPLSNGPMGSSEAVLRDDINDELFWSPFVDADQVKVEVVGNTATLTGRVDSWSEYDAATENAFEGGATVVINNLTVK